MKLTVIKCGGALDPVPVCADVARIGTPCVLVHGGAPQIARLAAEMGITQRTLISPAGVRSRYTDAAMLDVVTLAMTGRAKPPIVAALTAGGMRAIGLTGLDAGLLRAKRKGPRRTIIDGRTVIVRDDHSGRVLEVADGVVRDLLDAGFTPVVSPPAAGEDGLPLNVDADRVAAAIAAAMSADRLVLLTAAPGVLADAADETSVLPRCALTRDGPVPYAASGGMYRKLIAAREALLGGVGEVLIADGRITRPLTEISGTPVEVTP